MRDDSLLLGDCDGCDTWLVDSVDAMSFFADAVVIHCRCGQDTSVDRTTA